MTIAQDTYLLERGLMQQGYKFVAGVDEAGRGPLAGPVVAGCVVLPPGCEFQRFRDSKKLTAKVRDSLFDYLRECRALVGVGIVSAGEIERLNILQASLAAMKLAVEDLAARNKDGLLPDYLLVDGKFTVPMALAQQALIKGESKSASIAAASIVAKVTRDRLMAEYHKQFPLYNFAKNQGYPTKEHRAAIEKHGPCPIHRKTFKGVKEFLDNAPRRPEQRKIW